MTGHTRVVGLRSPTWTSDDSITIVDDINELLRSDGDVFIVSPDDIDWWTSPLRHDATDRGVVVVVPITISADDPLRDLTVARIHHHDTASVVIEPPPDTPLTATDVIPQIPADIASRQWRAPAAVAVVIGGPEANTIAGQLHHRLHSHDVYAVTRTTPQQRSPHDEALLQRADLLIATTPTAITNTADVSPEMPRSLYHLNRHTPSCDDPTVGEWWPQTSIATTRRRGIEIAAHITNRRPRTYHATRTTNRPRRTVLHTTVAVVCCIATVTLLGLPQTSHSLAAAGAVLAMAAITEMLGQTPLAAIAGLRHFRRNPAMLYKPDTSTDSDAVSATGST